MGFYHDQIIFIFTFFCNVNVQLFYASSSPQLIEFMMRHICCYTQFVLITLLFNIFINVLHLNSYMYAYTYYDRDM